MKVALAPWSFGVITRTYVLDYQSYGTRGIRYHSHLRNSIPGKVGLSLSSTVSKPTYSMANGKRMNHDNATGKGPKKERATHFLCFPLASESTVPELARSLEYFRSVSTEPERRLELTADGKMRVVTWDAKPASRPAKQGGTNDVFSTSEGDDPLGNEKTLADSLKVLPSVVHRAAGTYHLTLGVMDLTEEARMQMAKDLLQSLNLPQLLRNAEIGAPKGTKQAKKWEEKSTEETGEVDDGGSVHGETKDDNPPASLVTKGIKSLERPVSPPPSSTLAAPGRPLPEASNTATLPLHVSIIGLGAFPKHKAARVLWARPREHSQTVPPWSLTTHPTFTPYNTRLYNLALHIREVFRQEGFITETRPLVLHATVANMRYKTQAKGGRTSKGRNWADGKKRWKEGLVDARDLVRVFGNFGGDVEEAEAEQAVGKDDGRDEQREDQEKGFVWLKDAMIDRVAICKMGATVAEDPLWGYWYPPVVEKMIAAT